MRLSIDAVKVPHTIHNCELKTLLKYTVTEMELYPNKDNNIYFY